MVLLAGACPVEAAQVTLLEPLNGEWTARDRQIVLRVDDRPPASEGRIAVFVGTNDMTALCAQQRSGELRCSPTMLHLPEGEQEIVVYLVKSAAQWQEIARLPLKVLSGAGLEVSELTPRLDLSETSQFKDGSIRGGRGRTAQRFR